MELQAGPKKTKKGGKGKPKKGKGKPKAEEPEDEPLDYLTPEYNNFTRIQSLSLECKETKIFTAFKGLLSTGFFPDLKSLSVAVPDGGFTIQDKANPVVDSALCLIGLLEGKPSGVKGGKQNSSKLEITIKNYENALKNRMKDISNLGNINRLIIELAKTKEGEIKEIFKNIGNLKELSLELSPQTDLQIKEMYEGLKALNSLKSLELYFKNYSFSKDSINGIFEAIIKHSGELSKLCLGFSEVDHINDTVRIMDAVMKMPKLTILKLYLGYVGNYKKILKPLEELRRINRLTEFEFGGFFNLQSVKGIGEYFRDILYGIKTLRALSLKVVWHYNMWDGGGTKEDFTSKLGEVDVINILRELYVDFENSTWYLVKPK